MTDGNTPPSVAPMPSSPESNPGKVLAADHPLWKLEDAQLGPYRLRIVDARQLPSSGWKGFRLALRHEGTMSREPLLEGIHSVGGRGVAPWFDVNYRPRVELVDADTEHQQGRPSLDSCGTMADLRDEDLELPFFRRLREMIPANGHLMVSYETPHHRDTHHELKSGVPPIATPLGWLAWQANFNGGFKDWHISEGGHEGPKKLQINVPLDLSDAATVRQRARQACLRFLAAVEHKPSAEGDHVVWETTIARTRAVLSALGR